MSNKLDVSSYPERGRELASRIEKDVQRTQKWFIHELPNELHLTLEQFNSLLPLEEQRSYISAVEGIPDLGGAGTTKKAYIFYTPSNAMDVVVIDDIDSNLKENL